MPIVPCASTVTSSFGWPAYHPCTRTGIVPSAPALSRAAVRTHALCHARAMILQKSLLTAPRRPNFTFGVQCVGWGLGRVRSWKDARGILVAWAYREGRMTDVQGRIPRIADHRDTLFGPTGGTLRYDAIAHISFAHK